MFSIWMVWLVIFLQEVVYIGVDIVEVLYVVYVVGIVYWDVKLLNVFFVFLFMDGDCWWVKFVDFGIVCMLDVLWVIFFGFVFGMVVYMVLEQLCNVDVYFVFDIYVFGFVLFEVLIG